MVMYQGIKPPLNNKQKMNVHISTLRPGNCLLVLDSGYAASDNTSIVNAAPRATRCTDTHNDLKKSESDKIASNEYKLKPIG
jgi:hypothetical protein